MLVIGVGLGIVLGTLLLGHVWAVGLAFAFGTVLGWGSHRRMVSNNINNMLERIKK